MNKEKRYIMISVVVMSLLMCFVDGVIKPEYMMKSIIKVVCFLLVPLVYFLMFKGETKQIKQLFVPKKQDFLKSFLLGVSIYALIIGAYMLLKNVFDFSTIAGSLTSDVGVNADNFLYVAIYISFVNSLLEEFFFRGFAFITLKKHTGRKTAYVFSSLMFAIYHVGMTAGWFHIIVFILALLGLFIGGCIFDYLNEKCDNIYPSWLVHMFANFGINTVGFILFGIL